MFQLQRLANTYWLLLGRQCLLIVSANLKYLLKWPIYKNNLPYKDLKGSNLKRESVFFMFCIAYILTRIFLDQGLIADAEVKLYLGFALCMSTENSCGKREIFGTKALQVHSWHSSFHPGNTSVPSLTLSHLVVVRTFPTHVDPVRIKVREAFEFLMHIHLILLWLFFKLQTASLNKIFGG